jgi:S-adenosylmethionine:tRNA ribosyltransferase-isomerase
VEILLLAIRNDLGTDYWEALVRPGRRLRAGQRVLVGDGLITAEILERTPSGGRIIHLVARGGTVAEAITCIGTVPLPPYIHAPLADAERYQTVYARQPGSAAAPTAGLHFTPELLASLTARGIGLATVTLHIGLDTFRPIEEANLDQHVMHSEEIELDAEAAAMINATRSAGGRIVAVGTTSVRVLESVAALTAEQRAQGELADAQADALVLPWRGRTSLFLRPGSVFRAVDVMITNFHLPHSTLLVLVSAFAGRELVLRAYEEAVAQRYRFYSFGDAMLIL